MKTVVEYIKQALFDHNCVIIPDFGGFLTEYKPADINTITFDFAPPSIDLTFNSSLQKDDGLLKSEISLGESLDFKEAESLIRKFVREIKSSLEESGYHKISGLGEFHTKEGNIVYIPSDIENLNSQCYGLPKFAFDPIDRNTEDMKRVRPVPPARRVVKRRPVEKTEASEEKKIVTSTSKEEVVASSSDNIETKTTESSAPVKAKVEKTKNASKAKKEVVKKEKNKKPLFVILPIFLVLIAAGIVGFLYNKNGGFGAHNNELVADTEVENSTTSNEAGIPGTGTDANNSDASANETSSSTSTDQSVVSTTSDESNVANTATAISDSESKETTGDNTSIVDTKEESSVAKNTGKDNNNADASNVKEVEESVPTVTNDNSSDIGAGYNIIIGSFAIKSNAEKVVSNTPGSAIVNYNGLNCVSIGTYSDLSSAKDAFSQKRNEYSDAWLVNIK